MAPRERRRRSRHLRQPTPEPKASQGCNTPLHGPCHVFPFPWMFPVLMASILGVIAGVFGRVAGRVYSDALCGLVRTLRPMDTTTRTRPQTEINHAVPWLAPQKSEARAEGSLPAAGPTGLARELVRGSARTCRLRAVLYTAMLFLVALCEQAARCA